VVQGRLCQQSQRVGLLLGHARSFFTTRLLVQRLPGSGQRPQQQRADLRREPSAEHDHAVFVLIGMERSAHVL
jgi:hypothetical protein